MDPLENAPETRRDNPKKRGSRLIGGVIILLIILFFAIDVFIRESQQFSPTSLTNILLSSLQITLLLLGLILAFILGRNLVRLYLERKRKVVGSHFKTKLVFFFIALSSIPTLLLFLLPATSSAAISNTGSRRRSTGSSTIRRTWRTATISRTAS
jgi:nitrogen fixation/metabolism regulation signal transduction histidine kinase